MNEIEWTIPNLIRVAEVFGWTIEVEDPSSPTISEYSYLLGVVSEISEALYRAKDRWKHDLLLKQDAHQKSAETLTYRIAQAVAGRPMVFEPGQRVTYVPHHANGDPRHKDVEHGTVKSLSANGRTVWVKFDVNVARLGWDGATSKGCSPENLIAEREASVIKL